MKQCRQDEARWHKCLDAHLVVVLKEWRYRMHCIIRAELSKAHHPRTRNRAVSGVHPLDEEAVRQERQSNRQGSE
jgi:hypothetical protein